LKKAGVLEEKHHRRSYVIEQASISTPSFLTEAIEILSYKTRMG